MVLALARDEISIPVVRRLLARALGVLGVEDGIRGDIEVAITEACTNVLEHACNGQEYEVSVGIVGDTCAIAVRDRGTGFDATATTPAAPTEERGRGISLMRALVDRLHFESRPDQGTTVLLEKRLRWRDGAPIMHLATTTDAVRR